MSRDYHLDLYQNAIDSLDESIQYYKISIEDEAKYKFCIILLSHFMELLLKHLVELQNPLLCYEKPFSEKINKEKTITWNQAVQILLNSKIFIDEDIRTNLLNLAHIRNNIIHYKFEYNTSEIRKAIIDIVSDMRTVYKNVTQKDFYDNAKDITKKLLEDIQGEYSKDLHLAQAEAKEEANGEEVYDCEICGSEETVNIVDEKYFCYYCKESDCIEECIRCGQKYRESELYKFGEDEEGNSFYICEYCNDDLESE